MARSVVSGAAGSALAVPKLSMTATAAIRRIGNIRSRLPCFIHFLPSWQKRFNSSIAQARSSMKKQSGINAQAESSENQCVLILLPGKSDLIAILGDTDGPFASYRCR
jgi:hypothetical protein